MKLNSYSAACEIIQLGEFFSEDSLDSFKSREFHFVDASIHGAKVAITVILKIGLYFIDFTGSSVITSCLEFTFEDFLKKIGGHMSFCGATDTPVLDF